MPGGSAIDRRAARASSRAAGSRCRSFIGGVMVLVVMAVLVVVEVVCVQVAVPALVRTTVPVVGSRRCRRSSSSSHASVCTRPTTSISTRRICSASATFAPLRFADAGRRLAVDVVADHGHCPVFGLTYLPRYSNSLGLESVT